MKKTSNILKMLQGCGQIFAIAFVLCVLLAASVFAADKSSAKGSYTTADTARYLANGSTISGQLTEDDLIDFYRIVVPSEQKVKITYVSGVYDSMFEIFDASDDSVYSKNLYYVDEGTTKSDVYEDTLSAGTYYIRIKPWSNNTYTGSYKISFVMPNYTPSGLVAPLGLKVTGKDYKTVQVSWRKVNNISGYHLYVSNTLNGYYKKCATVKKNTQTSVTLSNLVPGKNYFFKIQT
ncbi:MAG: fibronectin type III domain-containing protein, partial [Eubacteriales bacterium]|nr:fibronectin type III domain-containing protein [Eubacteriales bacterium]